MIPFNEADVIEIYLEGGSILIDPVAAGLISEDDPDDDNPHRGRA